MNGRTIEYDDYAEEYDRENADYVEAREYERQREEDVMVNLPITWIESDGSPMLTI